MMATSPLASLGPLSPSELQELLICYHQVSAIVEASLRTEGELGALREELLVDVRNPGELQQHGTIPGSINLPLKYCTALHCIALHCTTLPY